MAIDWSFWRIDSSLNNWKKMKRDIRLVPALAFFMPLIAAMAGNVGVQSSAIVVQSLASHRKPENIGKKTHQGVISRLV